MTIPAGMWCICLHCGHEWVRRALGRPKLCAGCHTPNWDIQPGTLKPGRPPKAAGKAKKAARHIDADALGLWERLKDFERWGFAARSMKDLLAGMAEPMREDSLRIGPELSAWLKTAQPASAKKRKAGR